MLTVDGETARRFILGKQRPWPGRRWRGIRGTEQAMRAIEYLQLDPLQVVARGNNRDFEMATRTRTQSYRGRKDSALALYYLWRTGEVMTHHRDVPFSKAGPIRQALLAAGELIEVRVEGWNAVHYAPGSDARLLRALGAGLLQLTN